MLPDHWNEANVSQIAWNLLQDSFHLKISERSEFVALGVLKLAIESTDLEISHEGTSVVWWKVGIHFSN